MPVAPDEIAEKAAPDAIAEKAANSPSRVDDWYALVFKEKQHGLAGEVGGKKRPIVEAADAEGREVQKKSAALKVMPQRTVAAAHVAAAHVAQIGHDNVFKLGGVTHYQGAVNKLSLGQKVVLHAEGDSNYECSAVRVTPLGSDETIGYIPKAECSIDPDLTLKARQLIRCGKGIARVTNIGEKGVAINIQLDDVALRYVRMIIQLDEQKRSRRRQSTAGPPATIQSAPGPAVARRTVQVSTGFSGPQTPPVVLLTPGTA